MQTDEKTNASELSKVAPRQVLTFCLGDETYGVDILRVQEIRGWTQVTRIPHTSPQVLGVLNLRGSIVPIVDLRVQFSLAKSDFTPLTVIVVLSVQTTAGKREVGLVVDSVSDVIDIEPAALKDAPELGSRVSDNFIHGLATIADRMLILLDVDELIRHDLEQVKSAALPSAA